MQFALFLALFAIPFLSVNALRVSASARCGKQSRDTLTCKNSAFGDCCSQNGYCGSTKEYCETGCQSRFGDCISSTSLRPVKSPLIAAKPLSASKKPARASAKPVLPSANSFLTSMTPSLVISRPSTVPVRSTLSTVTTSSASTITFLAPMASSSLVNNGKVSTDGSCGGSKGFSCSGSEYGDCCSQYGWCGSTGIYCDSGCNAAFGDCKAARPSVGPPSSKPASSALTLSTVATLTRSSAIPSTTKQISTNAQCGPSYGGMTCLGSQFGDCCSQYSYCGSTDAFCGTGCQAGFGKCENDAGSPPLPSTSAIPWPSKTCGVEGFANKTEYYASSFNLIPATDVSPCAKLCFAEATCMSYIFNVDLQNCAYLTYSLSQGDFIATSGTKQLFYDRTCAEAIAP